MILSRIGLFLIGILFALPVRASWVDRSHEIFLPRALHERLLTYQKFSVFWWNFVVLKLDPSRPDWGRADDLCRRLKDWSPQSIRRVECQQRMEDLLPLAIDWATDWRLREPLPDATQMSRYFNESLAKAALPGSAELLPLLRLDPAQTWEKLKDLSENQLPFRLNRENGYFTDAKNGYLIIPIQLSYPPNEAERTQALLDKIKLDSSASFLGPHFSALANEKQVRSDLNVVSWAGLVILMLFTLAITNLRHWRLLLLLIPVAAAVVLASVVTVAVFGKIHGLVLAFGPGIVGLTLDYGLHAAFAVDRKVWRANLVGLMTTLAGLLLLMMSAIPLLKQLMFFSSTGLILGFIFLWAMFWRWPDLLASGALPIRPRSSRVGLGFVMVLLLASIWGFFNVKPNLDMQRFDFRPKDSQAAMQWLLQNSVGRATLFSVVTAETAQDQNAAELAWAETQGIKVENQSRYLPSLSEQARAKAAWGSDACGNAKKQLTEDEMRFFAPFFSGVCSETYLPSPQKYTEHLRSGPLWLTVWLPETEKQELEIRAQFPQVISLREVVAAFPKTLMTELKWMVPIAFSLALILIILYFLSVPLTTLALLPFLTGVGLLSAVVLIFKWEFSFISVIGTVMVFGLSIDYGIFVADAVRAKSRHEEEAVWTAVIYAAVTTVAGFSPLLFCQHPVLLDLGRALFFGTLGTYLGATWGVSYFMRTEA